MSSSDHISSTADNKGIFHRQRTYRQNGYDEIKGNAGKNGIYGASKNNWLKQALKKYRVKPRPKGSVAAASDGHAARYYFTYGRNFQVGRSPYVNEAHHLIPVESTFVNPPFTSEQLILLRKVDYNINNGENIIFLPTTERGAEFHNLPIHNGDHPRYTNLVKADTKKISQSLQKEIDKDPNHDNWTPPSDVVQKLKNLEDKYWNFLKNAGQIKVNHFKKPKKKSKKKAKK